MLKYADRIKETSSTGGTGPYELSLGAETGFQTFAAGIGDGNQCEYCATDGTDWEVGLGTVDVDVITQLTRDVIYSSSNSNNVVNWGAGTRTLFCTPAARSLNKMLLPRGYIDGLEIANNAGDPDHRVDIKPGLAALTDGTDWISAELTSILTKRLDAAWASGGGTGGLDTGTIQADQWYHVFLIYNRSTGVTNGLLSLSATSPTMPSGFTFKRRLASVLTDGSANIISFLQTDDLFLWDVPVLDVSDTDPGTNQVTPTLTVPDGIEVLARTSWTLRDSNYQNDTNFLLSSPKQVNTAPSSTIFTTRLLGSAGDDLHDSVVLDILTNTSSQVRYRINNASGTTNHSVYEMTHGWVDPRGKNA